MIFLSNTAIVQIMFIVFILYKLCTNSLVCNIYTIAANHLHSAGNELPANNCLKMMPLDRLSGERLTTPPTIPLILAS